MSKKEKQNSRTDFWTSTFCCRERRNVLTWTKCNYEFLNFSEHLAPCSELDIESVISWRDFLDELLLQRGTASLPKRREARPAAGEAVCLWLSPEISPEIILNVTLLNLLLPFNVIFLFWLTSAVIMNWNAKTRWLLRTPKSREVMVSSVIW